MKKDMFYEALPSKEDIKLLKKLDIQGEGIIEDLFNIFSYHRPKEYKIYVENIEYNPQEKGKIILDLIFTIQKYNKLVKKEMEIFNEKGETNKYFSDLYKGAKFFGKSVTSRSCGEILNNLIPKYAEKHLRFKNDFLKKNIFTKSGLLPNNLKQFVEFFDNDVRKNGVNSYKSIKYTKFIEKLYKNVQSTIHRNAMNNSWMEYENEQDKLYKQKQEKIMKNNIAKMRRREINLDKKEIEKLKMLDDIAKITYDEIMESINKRNTRKINKAVTHKQPRSKSKSRSRTKRKTHKEELNANMENDRADDLDDTDNLKENEKKDEKSTQINFNTGYNEQYNQTLSLEKRSGSSFFNNNQATSTTRFMDSKNNTTSTNFNLYNVHQDLLNKLNNLKMKKEKEKEKEKAMLKLFPIYAKTFSRNKDDKSFFPEISKKAIIDQNRHINLMINPVLNSTTNNFQILKSSSSSPFIFNLANKSQKTPNEIHHKTIMKKKDAHKRGKAKLSKIDIFLEHKKKVPIIYEELRKIKNLLHMSRRNTSKSSRAVELFTELYGKKKVSNINEKKASKELYNYYYNMKVAIERKDKTGTIFKKYINMINESLENKLEKSKEQDQQLKNKYYDLVDVMIKKKLESENENFE